MPQEKEIKIQLKISLTDFIDRITSKGYRLTHTLDQTDIYFDKSNWFLYENIAALRLRQINNQDSSFSFKKVFFIPKLNDYYVEEIEVKFPVSNFDDAKQIFKRINVPFKKSVLKTGQTLTRHLLKHGFNDEQRMPKIRKAYSNGDDEVTIDDIKDVGLIIELECKDNNPLHVVKGLLKDEEWERSVEGTSYIWLKKVKGLTSHISNIKRFKSVPDWNVWDCEKQMYLSISK